MSNPFGEKKKNLVALIPSNLSPKLECGFSKGTGLREFEWLGTWHTVLKLYNAFGEYTVKLQQ